MSAPGPPGREPDSRGHGHNQSQADGTSVKEQDEIDGRAFAFDVPRQQILTGGKAEIASDHAP